MSAVPKLGQKRFNMAEVRLQKTETSEQLIRRFIRKCKKEHIIEEVLERQYYKKPAEKRREAYYRRLAVIQKLKAKEAVEKMKDE